MNKKKIISALLISYIVFSIIEAIIVYNSIIKNSARLDNATNINYSDSLASVIAALGEPDIFFETQGDSLYTEIYYSNYRTDIIKTCRIKFINKKVVFMKLKEDKR